MTTYTAMRCPCGYRGCSSWMVDPVAAVRGVSFTEEQARRVASLLNHLEAPDPLLASAEALVRGIYDGKLQPQLDDATVRSVAEKIVNGLPRSVRDKNQR